MTQIYRHFSGDGTLLYVGISSSVSWRLLAHQRNAGWWKDVRTVTISAPFITRAEALAAEAEAIRIELPKFNQQHHPDPVKPPIAAANLGKDLLKRLKARQRAGDVVKPDFETRVSEALAMLKPLPDRE
jgi:predicted GIY-YIG superfamily endonuclease